MTRITITDTKVDIDGHASFAIRGSDIVCAAISTLTFTLINSAHEMCNGETIETLMDGRINIEYQHPSTVLKLLIDAFIIGVKGVESLYPENVKVTVEQAWNSLKAMD